LKIKKHNIPGANSTWFSVIYFVQRCLPYNLNIFVFFAQYFTYFYLKYSMFDKYEDMYSRTF